MDLRRNGRVTLLVESAPFRCYDVPVFRVLAVLFCLFLTPLALARGGDPYERISDQAKARELFQEVRADLKSMFGISVSSPVELFLVDAKVMDDLFKTSPYRGAEIGLYLHKNGRHQVYVMKDWSRDLCAGVAAHEYVHAWQQERCPENQELVIREGFARWVEAKYFDKIGAYQMVENIRDVGDPIYGVGYKTMVAWEDKYGIAKLVQMVQRISKVSEAK